MTDLLDAVLASLQTVREHMRNLAGEDIDVASYNSFTNTVRVGERAERLWISQASAPMFATLGVAPVSA